MGFLDPKALRDWIKSRAVNNLMATAKGFFLDARVGPVIQEKIIDISQSKNKAREFMCLFAFGNYRVTIIIPNFFLGSTGAYYYGGGTNGTDDIYAVCNFTDTSATFVAFSKGGIDLSGGVMIVYYR